MRTRTVVLTAVLAASVALLVFAIVRDSDRDQPATTGLRVVVIGVDGLDWFLLGKFLEEGSLPTLGTLMSRSRTGEVTADRPVLPCVGWTRLARGTDLSETELSRIRNGAGLFGVTPELARLVEAAGGRGVSVGWPCSWPAITSGAITVAPYARTAPVHETGLPPAFFRGGVGQASSDDLATRVDEAIERNLGTLDAEFERLIFDGNATTEGWRGNLAAARWAFLSDLVTLDLASALLADEEPDLALIHFWGLDAVGHRFTAPAMPEFFQEIPEGSERYTEVLGNYYRFIDAAVTRLWRLGDERTILVVCSAYGTHASGDIAGASGSHSGGPPGVFIVWGADTPTTQRPLSVSTLDIVPTVLAALGLPIPEDADGRVLVEALPGGLLDSHPLTFAGTLEAESAEPNEADISTMNELWDGRLREFGLAVGS